MEKIKLSALIFFFLFFFSLFHPLIFSMEIEEKTVKSTAADLLIITPKKFQKKCHKLLNHKNEQNIETILKTTDEIFEEFNGVDKQEKIKYCIKQAYDQLGVSFVLLIGDFREIPVRYCYNNDEYNAIEPKFISDLYYADIYDDHGIFSSWNTDNDRLFGEWNGPWAEDINISLTPEIALGRFPCSNRFEVITIVNKIIQYENAESFEDWFKKIVVAGGDTYSEARGYSGEEFEYYEGENLTADVIKIMNGFDPIILWASKNSLSTYSLLSAINKGCGFLYLSGHGNPAVWLTHPPNSAKNVGTFSNSMVPLCWNKDCLPVCILGGCQNSKFDVHIVNLFNDPFYKQTWRKKCLSWKLVSSPFGGTIATIGCTGLSWQGIEFGGGGANWLNTNFFKEYKNETQTLGTIWKNTLTNYLRTYQIDWGTASGGTSSINAKTVQEWILIGDPSLQIKEG